MPVAIDTVGFAATNPGASPAAGNATVNAGDSATIRAFQPSGQAYIDFMVRQGASEGFIELRSPRLADNVRGLHLITTETPAVLLLPQEVGQPVYPADALTVTISGGGAEVDCGAFGVYYTDLGGSNAVVHNWSELRPSVVNLKPMEVDFTSTVGGVWLDTVITTTENLLKANLWYAVLGYISDVALTAVGLKGPETGNYRLCGPGPTTTFRTDEYFIWMGERHGRPYIPCFNANNRGNLFVSAMAVAAAATKVTLILAELAPSFAP